MQDEFIFFSEVRVVGAPNRPELEGAVGAILGITQPEELDVPPMYAVMLDNYDRVVQFYREQLEATGRSRSRDDYY
ncbi:hypothetical protein [Streptomyces sp. NPDC054784]